MGNDVDTETATEARKAALDGAEAANVAAPAEPPNAGAVIQTGDDVTHERALKCLQDAWAAAPQSAPEHFTDENYLKFDDGIPDSIRRAPPPKTADAAPVDSNGAAQADPQP
jgi:hypothetical protein